MGIPVETAEFFGEIIDALAVGESEKAALHSQLDDLTDAPVTADTRTAPIDSEEDK